MFVDLINNWDEATTVSKELREEFQNFSVSSLEKLNLLESKNKDSAKAVFKLEDRNIIETVLMKHIRPARTPSLQLDDLAGQDDVKREETPFAFLPMPVAPWVAVSAPQGKWD